MSDRNPYIDHFILGNNHDSKMVWLDVAVDVSSVRINGWKTSDLLRMMDSMICIIRAYHVIHTLVMLMVKPIALAKYANMFNPRLSFWRVVMYIGCTAG